MTEIDPNILSLLRSVDTPTICNTLELATGGRSVRGFTLKPVVCADAALPPIVGFARTARIRASAPSTQPEQETRAFRLAYYDYMATGPAPSMVVIEDEDPEPIGSFWGEVNVGIHKGLGLEGTLTNGSLRDLGSLDPSYQVVAGVVGPSHAFVHVTAIDCAVTVLGLPIQPGDLVHADRHGAAVIPARVLDKIPAAVNSLVRCERRILDAARSPGFNMAALRAVWGKAEDVHSGVQAGCVSVRARDPGGTGPFRTLISDARMSGTAVLHAAPEAAVDDIFVLIQDGGMIELDVPARRAYSWMSPLTCLSPTRPSCDGPHPAWWAAIN